MWLHYRPAHEGEEAPPGRPDPASALRAEALGRLLARRIVFLAALLTETEANRVTAELLHLELEDPDADVHLYVNCSGGSTQALLAVYDTMQAIVPDVCTVAVGEASGAAAVLLASGSPGKRFALPSARIWIQQAQHEYQGQPGDVDIRAREILRQRDLVDRIVALHTRQPLERVARDTQRDFIMSAEQARAYGIVDEIVTGRRLPHLRVVRSELPHSATDGGNGVNGTSSR